jgi:mRNA interferase MazF
MKGPLQWAIVMADLDPVKGSEQRGLRPVLVVSNEEFNQVVSNVTVLPLTSTVRPLYPTEVAVKRGTAGLTRDSIVMAHQIRTISQRRLRQVLGTVHGPDLRRAIREAMAEHLDLI